MTYTRSNSWTAAEDAALQALWGQTDRNEIARAVGRSPDAVSQRAIRLGLAEQKGANPIAMERLAERSVREGTKLLGRRIREVAARRGVQLPILSARGL